MKLRPVDFSTDGVFVCGLAHSPKFIDESISQASAVAARVATILSKDEVEAEGITAKVDEDRCRGCGFCVEICPYDAIDLVDANRFGNIVKVARVNEILCKGCGACAGSCLSNAIQQKMFEDEQILNMIKNSKVIQEICS